MTEMPKNLKFICVSNGQKNQCVPYEVSHGVEGAVLGAHDALRVNQKQVFLGAPLHSSEDVLAGRSLRFPDEKISIPL